MATRSNCSSIWRGLVWSALFYALFLLTAPGVRALKFVNPVPDILTTHVGWSVDFNCTTNDPNATVSLLFSDNFGYSWSEKSVTPNKVALDKQVFTLMNLVFRDGGIYSCKATDDSGQTIQWQRTKAYLFVRGAELPRHFVLIPDKSIHVLQGQNGQVTCECEGATVSKLKWEKRKGDGSYSAVHSKQVHTTTDICTNRVRAVLKITNAQLADAGTYKCTVEVDPDKSDYKLTKINVHGVRALKFVNPAPDIFTTHVGWSVDFNCTTNDPNATVSLLFSDNFGSSWSEKSVTPNKVALDKQVFTLMNLVLRDGGIYSCKATDDSGQTIQWQRTKGYLFVRGAELPRHFVLIPDKSIHVVQGQNGQVTCECEGATVSKLKWEKRQGDGSYSAVHSKQVHTTTDMSTNRVRAVLKITNAQLADAGTYKCTVEVEPDKSDYKLTKINVHAQNTKRTNS